MKGLENKIIFLIKMHVTCLLNCEIHISCLDVKGIRETLKCLSGLKLLTSVLHLCLCLRFFFFSKYEKNKHNFIFMGKKYLHKIW